MGEQLVCMNLSTESIEYLVSLARQVAVADLIIDLSGDRLNLDSPLYDRRAEALAALRSAIGGAIATAAGSER